MPPDVATSDRSFAYLLRAKRRAAGLTQAELAERSGLSVRGISDLERGVRTRPQHETVQRLLSALEGTDASGTALLRAAAIRPVRSPRQPQRRHTIPVTPGPLIGRDAEMALLRQLLAGPGSSLVTLTGPGGSGKTRLALQIASDAALRAVYPGGVVLVELADLRVAAQLLPRLATALKIPEQGDRITPAQIASRFRGRRRLLILDNLEQVIDAAPQIAALAACGVDLLTTSREPLNLRAERRVPVLPLALPDPAVAALAAVMAAPAVRLFSERATAIAPFFRLTPENAATVASICARLDGLPLAIELAAAQLALLTPAALLTRLEQRLPLPADGPRDLPRRQQTLQATIAWSDELLTAEQRHLFHRLSVFAGGCTPEAATAIGGPGALSEDVLVALTTKHLLRVTADSSGNPRFAMLETIRDYAAQQLRREGGGDAVRSAHLAWSTDLARACQIDHRDATLDARLGRLRVEAANLRTALDWASTAAPAGALALLDALGLYWFYTGQIREGLAICAQVLTACVGGPALQRARVLRQAAWLATNLGDFPRAKEMAKHAAALAGEHGNAREHAYVRFVQGSIAQGHGNLAEAADYLGAALTAFRSEGDVWGALACTSTLGIVALDRGEAAESAALYEQVLQIATTQGGSTRDRAAAHCNLAVAWRYHGNHDRAGQHASRALTLTEVTPGTTARAGSLQIAARLALDAGDATRATALLGESMAIWREIGDQWSIATALESAAFLAEACAAPGDAAQLLGAAQALRNAIAAPASACAARERQALRNRLTDHLEPAVLQAALDSGALLSPMQALDLAQTASDRAQRRR